MLVDSHKLKKWFHAIRIVEQPRREVPVEKLHTIADGRWSCHSWEPRIERLKIQLQNEGVIAAANNQIRKFYLGIANNKNPTSSPVTIVMKKKK